MLLAGWGFLANQLWPLVGALALMGVHSTLFGPVKSAYLPQHLDTTELVGGNGLMEMGTFVAILLGEVLGAALATLPHGGLVTSFTLVAIALLGYGASRGVPDSPAADPGLKVNLDIFTETVRNLRFAKGNRIVWLSLMGISWFWFFGATLLAQFPTFAREVLGGDEHVFILLLTVFSLGIGAGSLLCERLSGRKVEIGLVPFGALGLTVFGVDLFLAARFSAAPGAPMGVLAFLGGAGHWRLMADNLLIGLFGGFYIVPLYALIQTRSEKSHQSRVIAANNILNALFMVVSAVVSMLLFKAGLSIPQLFLATALFNLVVAVYIVALVPEFLVRFLSWLLVHTVYRLRLENAGRIPDQGPALLVSNVLSYVDVLVILAASPRPIFFVIDPSLFRKPVLGWILRLMKAIPAGDGARTRAAVRRALDSGDLVAVFPEDRPGTEGRLGAFEAPLAELLAGVQAPILPVALAGLQSSLFSRVPAARRTGALLAHVSLRVGDPLVPQAEPGALREAMEVLL